MRCSVLMVLLLMNWQSFAQTITYSNPEEEDTRLNKYEIAGKVNGKFFIYKNIRRQHELHVYNSDMHIEKKLSLDFFPAEILETDFITTSYGTVLFYQFQKKDIVYLYAVKFSETGEKLGNEMELDTAHISSSVSSKIFNFIYSTNKQNFCFFRLIKPTSKTEKLFLSSFNAKLEKTFRSSHDFLNSERNRFFSEFQLDNNGNLFFLIAQGSSQNDNISNLKLAIKNNSIDSFRYSNVAAKDIILDDIKMRIDNANQSLLINAFYATKRRGDIAGVFCYAYSIIDDKELYSKPHVIGEEIRNNAKGDNSLKAAFNDYYIKQIIVRNDGGFVLIAEAEYSRNKNNNYSRWDYLNASPYWNNLDYMYYNNSSYNPYNRWGSLNDITRYFCDNIYLASFNKDGNPEWMNNLQKMQYDDNSDNYLSFGFCNTGENLNFIFNNILRNGFILNGQPLSTDGNLQRPVVLKNLDKGYDFMPKFAKQVGKKQLIVPCIYRSIYCFAKIDF